ncbi:MAG TPA: hypothetical protein VGO62_09945, partial [Myxococcota bacterium]
MAHAQAPIVGDIEGGEFRPLPIAVPELRLAPGSEGDKAVAAQISKIVRDDLALCGAFQVLESKGFIDTDGITQSTVKFPDWLNVGAAGLVKGQLKDDGGKLSVEVHGFEVAAAKEGLTKTLPGSKDNIRYLAHEISDEVFHYFTGEPGVFRTRIAYVQKVGGEKQIFVMDMDGNNSTQVTKGGGLNLLPSYAPDGRSLLFTSYR